MAYFKCNNSNIKEPNEGIYYDFRESLDMQYINGETNFITSNLKLNPNNFISPATVNKFSQTSNGLYLDDSGSKSGASIRMPYLYYIIGYDVVFEFETGELGASSSRDVNNIFVTCESPTNMATRTILGFNKVSGSNRWLHSQFNKVSDWSQAASSGAQAWYDLNDNLLTDGDLFDNCIIKVKTSPYNNLGTRLYKNDVLISVVEDAYINPSDVVYPAITRMGAYMACFGNVYGSNNDYASRPMTIKWFKQYYEKIEAQS